MNFESEKNFTEQWFKKREDSSEHSPFYNEIVFYKSICSGNMDFVNIFIKLLCCENCDNLSEDHLRNLKYNTIVRTALIAHYCIKGGMTSEKSYSIRDYYIMKTDKCKTESEIRTVHRKMIESYTNKMRHIKLRGVYSKQIVRALDYIIGHLYQRIFIKETAEYLKISPAYLSRLFKKETGLSFREYVNKLKIEEAAALLLYTQYETKTYKYKFREELIQ